MRDTMRDLVVLCDYLNIDNPLLIRSKIADENHRKSPRLFAFVEERKNAINVSSAMDALPPDIRMGLLLHELGHIHGSMDEVEADTWVLAIAPESGYHYEAAITFKSPLYEDPVTAKNVQCVSQQFIKMMGHMEED